MLYSAKEIFANEKDLPDISKQNQSYLKQDLTEKFNPFSITIMKRAVKWRMERPKKRGGHKGSCNFNHKI